MGSEPQILNQYLNDAGKLMDTKISLNGSLLDLPPDSRIVDVFDHAQIISNVPGPVLSASDEELNSLIEDERKSNKGINFESPTLKLEGIKTFDAMHLAYGLLIKEKFTSESNPVNISDIAFAVKNTLALPDEMFIDFPVLALEKEFSAGDPYLSTNGIVSGIRMYHVLYGMSQVRAIPCLAFPASFRVEGDLEYADLMERLKDCFEKIKGGPSYMEYIRYRMFKNIIKKFQSKNWNEVKMKMFPVDEVQLASEVGLFIQDGEYLKTIEADAGEHANEILNKMSLDAGIFLREWKETNVFS